MSRSTKIRRSFKQFNRGVTLLFVKKFLGLAIAALVFASRSILLPHARMDPFPLRTFGLDDGGSAGESTANLSLVAGMGAGTMRLAMYWIYRAG